MGCEEDGTDPPCPSLHPHSLLSACDAQSTRRELPERPQPELSSSSPVLTSPSSHPLPFQHQPGAEKGVRRAEGQARGKDEERGASRGGEDGRRWPGGWESLCLICFRLFKNKLRSSSGREEVGGNACAGGEREARQASGQKNNSSSCSWSQEKGCRAFPADPKAAAARRAAPRGGCGQTGPVRRGEDEGRDEERLRRRAPRPLRKKKNRGFSFFDGLKAQSSG